MISPISKMVNDSTQKSPVQNPPSAQKFPPLLCKFVSHLIKCKSPNINTLTSPNLSEHNNTPVVMANTHPNTLRVNQLPEVIIPDHNVQTKLNTQAGFLINILVLCPILYIYHDEVSRDDLME